MRPLALALLLAFGIGIACAEETPGKSPKKPAAKKPTLPALGDLNPFILEVMATYPTDGTHDYHWPKSGTWSGNCRTLHYDGKVLLQGDPKGRCYCCGLTFEVFLQAFEAWCKKVKRPYKLKDYDAKAVLKLKHDWFGSNGDRSTIHGAVTKRGLGVGIKDRKKARPGDFVQFWRHSGSGHSVVFKAWKKKGKQIIGLTYWSTQGSTDGIGQRTELFGTKGATIKQDEFYIVRIGDPKPTK